MDLTTSEGAIYPPAFKILPIGVIKLPIHCIQVFLAFRSASELVTLVLLHPDTMKHTSTFSLAVVILLAAACSQKATEETSDADSTVTSAAEPVAQPVTIVTWNEVSVRETPQEKGKYVTSIYLGEHITATGDTASEKSGSKRNHYHKITLSDGKTGWVRDEFIAIDVYPGVIMEESQIMKRPDAATIIGKKFLAGDLVSVKNRDGQFIEVTGRIAGDKWYSTGYVRSSSISYADIEIGYATMKRRANEETREELAAALLKQAYDRSLFGASALYVMDYGEEGVSAEEEEEEFTGDGQDPLDAKMQLYPPEEGLIAHYSFDNFDSNDQSGRGNHATKYGDIQTDGDKSDGFNSSLTFDGNSYLSVNQPNDRVTVPFTVVAYFKLADPNLRDQCIVARGRSIDGTGFNFGYSVNDEGTPFVYLGMVGAMPVGVMKTVSIEAGEWIFLAASFDGKVAKIYVNGGAPGTETIPEGEAQIVIENLVDSKMALEIGRELGLPGRYFNGSIDNVALWNRVLSPNEIAGMMK
jgi:hypothetical protein